MKTFEDFIKECAKDINDSVGLLIAHEKWGAYCTDQSLGELVGKTVESVSGIFHSGPTHNSRFTLNFTDGTHYTVSTAHGPTMYFTEFYVNCYE